MRNIRRFLLPCAACFCLLLTTLTSQGGCSLTPLSVECYRCPCGLPGYGCVGGRCLFLTTINSMTPAELDRYVLARCQQPLIDSGVPQDDTNPPPDVPTDCNCKPDEVCNPITRQCEPKPVCNCKPNEKCDQATGVCSPNPCPDGSIRQPDGSCPSGDKCKGVACPKDQACEPKTGACVKSACVSTLCPAPMCCHAFDNLCIISCRVCGSVCPTGYTCNQANSRCEKGGSTCRAGLNCIDSRSCCGRNCVRFRQNDMSGRSVRGCDCGNDSECAVGRSCVEVPTVGGARKMCSCLASADCGGGECLSVGGSRVCVYR